MKNCNSLKRDKAKKGKHIGSKEYSGDINLQIESAEDHTQVDEFCINLKTIDNLKISSYNWSEKKGLKIVISLKDAVPLGDMLSRMPQVDQVYKKRKDIVVVLIPPSSESAFPLPFASEEISAT